MIEHTVLDLNEIVDYIATHSARKICDAINVHPEIIHCRDCANYQTDWTPQTMPDGHYCFAVDTFMREDEFCSRAERREGEQDA